MPRLSGKWVGRPPQYSSNNWEILDPPLPELTEPHLLEFFLRGFPTFSVGIRDQFFHTMLTQPGKSLLPFSTGLGKKVVPSGLFHKIRFGGTHTNMCSVTQIHSTFNCESVFLNTNLCAFPEHRFYGIGRRLRECCRQSQAEVVSKSSNKIHQNWGLPFSRPL